MHPARGVSVFDVIAALGGGLFVLTSIATGLRLAWTGLRQRNLAEGTLGAGLFLIAGLGYPLLSVAQGATALSDGVRSAVLVGHMSSYVFGMGCIAFFTGQVFRPDSRAAHALALAVPISLAAAMALQIAGPGTIDYLVRNQGPWYVNSWIGLFILLWAGAESLHHHRLLLRRMRLGLADPVVVNRIFLWGCAMITASSMSASSLVLEALGIQVAGTAVGAAIIGPLGMVAAGTLYLAFWPPARYLSWVATRTQNP